MAQMAPWLDDAMHASAARLTEQLEEELRSRGRDTTDEPELPLTRPDGPLAGTPFNS